MNITAKECRRCKEIKPIDLFVKNKAKKTGYESQCKSCKKSYDKNYNILNKEKRSKEIIHRNTNGIGKFKYLLRKAKSRANIKGFDFDLNLEDIIIPECCPYLGVRLTFNLGSKHIGIGTNATIDRIDATKGYIKGNIEVISYLANTMKSNATLSDLVVFAHNILKLHGDDNGNC